MPLAAALEPRAIRTCTAWIARSSTALAVSDVESHRIGIRRIAIDERGLRHQRRARSSCAGPIGTRSIPTSATPCPTPRSTGTPAGSRKPASTTCACPTTLTSPAFMDACDELGLVVMDCIPGWQYFNPDPAFVELQYRNCRELIRRDRNRPCVDPVGGVAERVRDAAGVRRAGTRHRARGVPGRPVLHRRVDDGV